MYARGDIWVLVVVVTVAEQESRFAIENVSSPFPDTAYPERGIPFHVCVPAKNSKLSEEIFCPSTEKYPPPLGSILKETGAMVWESLHNAVPMFTANVTGAKVKLTDVVAVAAVAEEPATKLFSKDFVSSPETFLETAL
jgi:hypothetical protein